MTPEEIRQILSTMRPWHHNVELAPGVWTNPSMGNHPTTRWALIEPHVPIDLRGKTVLDLGCSSAFFSAMFKKRGAEKVVAVDIVDSAISEARLLTTVFETPVEIVQKDIYDFLIENRSQFDYVLFLGIFYHLRSPIFVLDKLAALTRERLYFQTWVRNEGALLYNIRRLLYAFYEMGVLVKNKKPRQGIRSVWRTLTRPLEIPDSISVKDSYIMSHPGFPKMSFIQKNVNNDPSNWWVGDTRTIRAILDSTGFRQIKQLSDDTFICDNMGS
jgi:tRNA (mo5U34)-methyltransferase